MNGVFKRLLRTSLITLGVCLVVIACGFISGMAVFIALCVVTSVGVVTLCLHFIRYFHIIRKGIKTFAQYSKTVSYSKTISVEYLFQYNGNTYKFERDFMPLIFCIRRKKFEKKLIQVVFLPDSPEQAQNFPDGLLNLIGWLILLASVSSFFLFVAGYIIFG